MITTGNPNIYTANTSISPYYSTVNHTHSFTGIPGAHTHRAYKIKPTPFQRAMLAVQGSAEEKYCEGGVVYRYIAPEVLINNFGKLKPVYNGRPQLWLNIFLTACPSPMRSTSKTGTMYLYQGMTGGMFYRLPFIPGRKKSRYRITASTMALLDHWAKYNPKFRPFLDAYLTNKARKQIAEHSALLAFGICPEDLKADQVKHVAAIAEIAEREKKSQEMALRTQIAYAQSLAQTQHVEPWTAYAHSLFFGNTPPIGGTKK